MTPKQIDLARHALGLPNEGMRSFRNSFVAGPGHPDYDDWLAMTKDGNAVRCDGATLEFGGDDLFHLTRKGAEAALERETLDPAGFPDPATAA